MFLTSGSGKSAGCATVLSRLPFLAHNSSCLWTLIPAGLSKETFDNEFL